MTDIRRTMHCTEGRPWRRNRSKRRQGRKWQDDIAKKEGAPLEQGRVRQTAMEGIGGGLHDAVDGQGFSLVKCLAG